MERVPLTRDDSSISFTCLYHTLCQTSSASQRAWHSTALKIHVRYHVVCRTRPSAIRDLISIASDALQHTSGKSKKKLPIYCACNTAAHATCTAWKSIFDDDFVMSGLRCSELYPRSRYPWNTRRTFRSFLTHRPICDWHRIDDIDLIMTHHRENGIF